MVNFIPKIAKTHRQFRNFIDDLKLEDKPSDVSFYCIVRWLSASNVLNRYVEVLKPITRFLNERSKVYPELEDGEWIQDLMFLTDIVNNLQTLKVPPPPPLPPPGGGKDHERPFAIPSFHQKCRPHEKCRPGAFPLVGALLGTPRQRSSCFRSCSINF